MGIRAAVAGASGYAGGELLRLLTDHPDIEPAVLAAGANAGQHVGDVHPHLPALAGERFAPTAPESFDGCDVVFVALPHGEPFDVEAPLVVDLRADHRLRDGAEPWPYGLVERHRDELRAATRIAVPGCYPTAVSLALGPLAHLVSDLVVVAASGTSGGGRGGPSPMNDMAAYKVARHQHAPEIAQELGQPLSFTAVLAPLPRGILATCTARTDAPYDMLRDALVAAYADEPFVRVLPVGQWPHTVATVGSNACHLQLAKDDGAGRVVVVSALDNLGKGAAGQAVQAANVALGLPETAGLTANGVAP